MIMSMMYDTEQSENEQKINSIRYTSTATRVTDVSTSSLCVCVS